jgi:hypothetical protein
MGRIARSWDIFKRSWAVLKQDKELAILPLISGTLILGIVASFVFGFRLYEGIDDPGPKEAVIGFVIYVLTYTTAFFFQAALVAGALERLNGGDPTLGSALRAAAQRLPSLLLWGVVAATVGMILRSIQERSELLGKIVIGLVGAAWSLATFFMVPVLVMEREGLGGSFKRSWAIFKQTWGESVAGNLGMGLIFFVAMLALGGIVALLVSMKLVIVGVVVGALGFVALMVMQAALSGIYLASVYRFATTGSVSGGFDRETILAAFREKPAK